MTNLPLRRTTPDASATRLPGTKLRAATHLERACYATAFHAADPYERGGADRVAKARWGDGITELVLRGSVVPATASSALWAANLASAAVGDFVSSLATFSAGVKLLDACMRVSLDGILTLSIPYRSGAIDTTLVGWITEGGPISTAQLALTAATLGPAHKLAILTTLTRETLEHASGETVLTTLLRENVAAALDASLFSTTAGTTDRPPGLLAGISALSAAAAGADAMDTDLSAIAGAIGTVTTGLAFVAHPAQAHAIRLRRGSTFPADVPVWPSLAVAEGTVIGLDPLALVSGFSAEPEISASRETLIHMETVPAQIGVAGSPPVVAAPSRSMFQTDCISLRLILRASWVWRQAGAAAWISGANW